MPSPSYQRRPATDADREFLWQLNEESYRHHIERIWGWDEAWQRNHFEEWLANEESVLELIEVKGELVGLLELEGRPGLLYVCNIQIVGRLRGQGLGTQLMKDVQAEAAGRGLDVALQVLVGNEQALAFYGRLGFVREGQSETHTQLRWSPPPAD